MVPEQVEGDKEKIKCTAKKIPPRDNITCGGITNDNVGFHTIALSGCSPDILEQALCP